MLKWQKMGRAPIGKTPRIGKPLCKHLRGIRGWTLLRRAKRRQRLHLQPLPFCALKVHGGGAYSGQEKPGGMKKRNAACMTRKLCTFACKSGSSATKVLPASRGTPYAGSGMLRGQL